MIARVELECAMAAIITSPSAKAHFEADAAAFAATFGLPDDEVAHLRRMGLDLGALTDGFVAKRVTTLRWSAKRTLALLGPAGTDLAQEFVDLHPAGESLRSEAGRFTDFVVDRTASGRDGSVRADVIAEMARFERCRSDSFWGAVAAIEPTPEHSALLRLKAGATVDSFDRDLRILYHDPTMAPARSRPDRCTLAFVHLGSAAGFRVLRLRESEERLVRSLAAPDPSPTRLDAAPPDDAAIIEADTNDVVHRLVEGGLLEWV